MTETNLWCSHQHGNNKILYSQNYISSNSLIPFIDNETGTILGLEVTWFVVVVISSLLVLLVLIVAVSICICRRGWHSSPRRGNGTVQQQNASYSCKPSKHSHFIEKLDISGRKENILLSYEAMMCTKDVL